MPKITSWLRIGSRLAFFIALFSLAGSMVAHAATTEHDGTYHVSGGLFNASSVNTPAYPTHTQAKTCVQMIGTAHNGASGNASEIELIWYDAGNDLVQWSLNVRSPGVYCSPWKNLTCGCGPKMFDRITAGPGDSIHGYWKIYTN